MSCTRRGRHRGAEPPTLLPVRPGACRSRAGCPSDTCSGSDTGLARGRGGGRRWSGCAFQPVWLQFARLENGATDTCATSSTGLQPRKMTHVLNICRRFHQQERCRASRRGHTRHESAHQLARHAKSSTSPAGMLRTWTLLSLWLQGQFGRKVVRARTTFTSTSEAGVPLPTTQPMNPEYAIHHSPLHADLSMTSPSAATSFRLGSPQKTGLWTQCVWHCDPILPRHPFPCSSRRRCPHAFVLQANHPRTAQSPVGREPQH